MKKKELTKQIREKKSYLCIGLDTDLKRIPSQFLKTDDPIFEFNKVIIDNTKDLCVAYKMNIAFYESLGYKGWQSLQKTVEYIPDNIFTIADAKRGDIGNTSKQYAKTFFETYDFDAITVSPYMGEDSISPFLEFDNKWVIILGVTSNKGSNDFQMLKTDGKYIYEKVLETSAKWGSDENIMFVAGATHPELFSEIRKIVPDNFLLIPGVGAQGGDLEKISKYALNKDVGVLVNVSRGIIFPKDENDFPNNVRKSAEFYQNEMKKYI
ncbi:MAG: orotidine-5'-phosphate decarboxylase [Bacteroidota bacterium]|nr:orotidine-5'-phosphate decarboxylase [Bacteroidota bacterium]